MKKITLDNIVDKLVEKFPEYQASSKYFDEENKDMPYIVLGNLTLMAFEEIDKRTDVDLAERLIGFTDEILNNPDSEDELLNLFQVQVFETLVAYRTGALLAKKLLHNKSLELLEQTLKHYNTDQFLKEYRKNQTDNQ